MAYLPMRAAHRGWNPPEKERYVADSNAGMAEPSKPSIPDGIIISSSLFKQELLWLGSSQN